MTLKKIPYFRLYKALCLGLAVSLCFETAVTAQTPQTLTLTQNEQPGVSADKKAASTTALAQAQGSTDFLQASPLAPSEARLLENGFNKEELIAQSLAYFDPQFGTVERTAEYPFEGFRQRGFTQPTAIGYYALLLADVVNGDVTSSFITPADAKTRLNRLADSLLSHQKTLGYKGLMPWLGWDGTKWSRRPGEFGQQVTLGDNANLSVSLGAAIGALLKSNVAADGTVKSIRSKLDTFLERQRPGFQYLYKADAGRFRRGWNFASSSWVGGDSAVVDYFGDEFRGGVTFIAARYGFADSVYTSLRRQTTEYTLSTGEKIQSVMPFDGGAFQMLWPSLTMPETDSAELNTMLRNFVRIALDHAAVNNLPGFLSASYSGIDQYAGNAGINALSANASPRNERASSLYTLGAAYQIAPVEVGALLERIFSQCPGLESAHGLWEGVNLETGQVVEEQIAANVITFVLGLAGTGPENMKRYLNDKALLTRLDSLYRPETTIDLAASGAGFLDFSTREGFFAAWTEGDEYHVLGDNVQQVLSVFFQKGVPSSASGLRIKYRSTTPVGAARLEFKEWEKGVLKVRHSVPLAFTNTGGSEQLMVTELPAGIGLFNIDEAVLVIEQGGTPIGLTLTDLDLAPADFVDAVTQSEQAFSWGSGISASAQGDEYRISSPAFTSSGTAFVFNSADFSGAELKTRFRSWTATGKVRIEFKQQTPAGPKTRLTLNNLIFGDTAGKEKELLVSIPLTDDLSDIDEVVFILEGGTGVPLDLTLTDFDFRLRASYDTLAESSAAVVWGDNGISGVKTAEGLAVSGPQFTNAYAALIQAGDGVNYSGKTLQIRYRATTAVGPVRFEFKTRTASGLVTQYVSLPVQLENTGGAEKVVSLRLPKLLELFNVHEIVMALTEGGGGPLALTVTKFQALGESSADLLKEAVSKATTGTTVTASESASGYRIQATRFSSANATLALNNLDVTGSREIRLRYKSTTLSGNVKFVFKTQGTGGLTTVLQTAAVNLANTNGEEQEVLIRLGDNMNLLGVDQVVLQLAGGTNVPLDLTVTALEIL